MKRFWFVLTSKTPDGKLYAAACPFTTSENLSWQFDPAFGTVTANICETKKQAEETARKWNEAYKRNGTYAFNQATKGE